MGLRNVIVTSDDFAKIHARFAGFFDKILLDAPCSGSAMFRKDELSREDWSKEKVARCAAIQRDLLEYAYTMLKPGGKLIYSTCSFSEEENEANVLSFLRDHNDMKPVYVEDRASFYHPEALKASVYLFPHRYEGEGQFFVLLRKDGDAQQVSFTKKKEKLSALDPLLISLMDEAHINGLHIIEKNHFLYGHEVDFDPSSLHVLRYGVELGENEKRFVPSHAFARAFDPACCIGIDKDDAKRYFSGETFQLKVNDGYHVVSYGGCPLGWVKVVQGVAKNHYPKGLRHQYKDDSFFVF